MAQTSGAHADDQDPSPWAEVTDDLLDLTSRIRETYRSVADESGPSEDEVRDAFRTLAGAWNQMAESVGAAIQDEDVRSHLKKAGSSLLKAIEATVSEIAGKESDQRATDEEGDQPTDEETP